MHFSKVKVTKLKEKIFKNIKSVEERRRKRKAKKKKYVEMDLNRVIFLLTNGAVDFLITKSSQPACNDFDMKAKDIYIIYKEGNFIHGKE